MCTMTLLLGLLTYVASVINIISWHYTQGFLLNQQDILFAQHKSQQEKQGVDKVTLRLLIQTRNKSPGSCQTEWTDKSEKNMQFA